MKTNCDNFNSVKQYRYIHDLIILNKDINLNTYFDFYPQYLVLLKTNDNQESTEFLDLDINVINGKIDTYIYDKRNDFKFCVSKLPFWDSNISISVFKNLLNNYIVRNNRLVTCFEKRKKNIKGFVDMAMNYGYPLNFPYAYVDKKYLI